MYGESSSEAGKAGVNFCGQLCFLYYAQVLLISWKFQPVQEESRTLGLSGSLFLKVSIPFLTLHKSALQVCPFMLRNSDYMLTWYPV